MIKCKETARFKSGEIQKRLTIGKTLRLCLVPSVSHKTRKLMPSQKEAFSIQ